MLDRLVLPLRRLPTRLQAWGIRGVIVAFLALGLIYSVSTPMLEALDEVWHVAVIHHIVHHGELPVQPEDPAETGLWRQQANQPPLYYLLGAGLVAWIDTDDFPSLVEYNPHASGGHPGVMGNKNILLHTPQAERFPWRGTALAVHLLRLYSLALGALTVYGIYRIAQRLWPVSEAMACLTAGLVAFNPQFLFIHAGVINDTLAIALCTWTLERLTWLLGEDQPLALRRWRPWALVGLLSGLALMSKLSAGFLIALVGLAVLYLAWRDGTWREGLVQLALVGAIALALSGWWFARNWGLYGDLTGLNRFIPVAGARPEGDFGLMDFVGELGGLELSYWAVFGWFSILGDPILYPFFQALSRLALLGLLLLLWRWMRGDLRVDQTRAAQLGLLTAWFLILMIALYRWTSDVMGSQGRLIFPGAASVAVGLALGLTAFLPPRWRTRGLGAVVSLLAAISLIAPFRYIAPAYQRPSPVASEAAIPHVLHLRYGDWGELVGYGIEERFLNPGEALDLTLYWRALKPITGNYDLYIHLRDPEGQSLGQLDTYPGWGMHQTSLWEPGEMVADRYRVPVTSASQEPILGRIEVGFGLPGLGGPVPAYDPQGRAVTPVLGRFKIRGTVEHPPPQEAAAHLGEAIALAGWEIPGLHEGELMVTRGDTLTLMLEWAPLERPGGDYTLFVHLAREDRRPVAQDDGEPQGGRYPTSWWEPGERVGERRSLRIPEDLAPGTYQVLLGFYQPGNGSRLSVTEDGQARGDAYRLPVVIKVE